MRFTFATFFILAMAVCQVMATYNYGNGNGGGYGGNGGNGGGYNNGATPSSTPGGGDDGDHWECPDADSNGGGKDDSKCDSWPFKSSIFSCAFKRDGYGGGGYGQGQKETYTCTFDANTGDCTGGGNSCPKSAYKKSWRYKREASPEPTPAPGMPPYARHAKMH